MALTLSESWDFCLTCSHILSRNWFFFCQRGGSLNTTRGTESCIGQGSNQDLDVCWEGDDRGWDGWMASPTQWTWVWVDSRSWWWTGRPGVLWFMGSQRVGHDWATELTDWAHLSLPLDSLYMFLPPGRPSDEFSWGFRKHDAVTQPLKRMKSCHLRQHGHRNCHTEWNMSERRNIHMTALTCGI